MERIKKNGTIQPINQPGKSGVFLRSSRHSNSSSSGLTERKNERGDIFPQEETTNKDIVSSETNAEPFKFNFSIPSE